MQAVHTQAIVQADNSGFWRIIREWPRYFLLFTLAAFALRLVFCFKFPHIAGDTFVYGDIAKNWLDHGIFGLTYTDGVRPTLIRLPGYPAFLAACFVLFGHEHYTAVLLVQVVVDVVTCFFIADLARRTVSPRAARFAFALAALCPFTANYTAAPLAETLSMFFAAIALDAAAAGFLALDEARPAWRVWFWCGLALACGILLRPDGGIVLIAIGLYFMCRMWRSPARRVALFWAGTLVLAVSLAPLVPWAIRNWRAFHIFQPLVTAVANDPDEFVPQGFLTWSRSWTADYVSTEDVFFAEPGVKLDAGLLPPRAFDSPEQRRRTQALIDDYNRTLVVDPQLDRQFMQLAEARIHGHLFRYYVWLPTLRITDMWLRPRTEMLPLDTRWWNFEDDPSSSIMAIAWGLLNLLFIFAAIMGVVRGPRPRYLGMMLLFVLIRSAFLGTRMSPEPRYTLECYPVVLLLGGAWIAGIERFRIWRVR